MAYETLKSDIQSYVKQNGEGAITGDGLQSILLEIVNTLGTGFKYVGVATPSTSPGTPTENVFYIGGKGIYANFGSTIEVEAYQICVFAYNGSWSKSVINVGSSFDVEDYPSGAAVEFTFYSAETPDGRSIKINKDVSGLSNEPDEAISQWWAAQKERKINLIAGYTIDFDSLDASSPSSLGLFKAIQTGQIIDSYTNATSLIFGTDGGQYVTINKSQLPYTATANLINVKSASDTLSNVSIKVRGSLENMPSYINVNEIANHPAAYANAAAALADVPEIYRRKGTKVVYFDDDVQLWIEMLCCDDAGGANWWTDVDNNWVIEGPIETEIATATGGQQLRIAGEKRGNLDDVLNVNVWNEQTYEYESKGDARAAVPANKRKLGGVITYLIDGMWYTEQFIGSSTSTWTTTESDWKVLGPVSVSQNTLTIGGKDKGELAGQLTENPEFGIVFTDNNNKILFGYKKKAGFWFGEGCPSQIQQYVLRHKEELLELIETKVDKVQGMSLIDAEFATTQKVIENPEYGEVKTDKDGKIYEGVSKNGVKKFFIPIETPTIKIDSIDNPEWKQLLTDDNGKIIEGLTKNKKVVGIDTEFLRDVRFKDIPQQIKEYVNQGVDLKPFAKNHTFGHVPTNDYVGLQQDYSFGDILTKTAEVYAKFDELVDDEYVTSEVIGQACDNQDIKLYMFGPAYNFLNNPLLPNSDATFSDGIPTIMIICGQHGHEKSSAYGLYYLVKDIVEHSNDNALLQYFRKNVRLVIVPVANPSGWDAEVSEGGSVHGSYKNANGVNLNRNWQVPGWAVVQTDPTAQDYQGLEAFDQPETAAIRDYILLHKDDIDFFIDEHTYGWSVVQNNRQINYFDFSSCEDAGFDVTDFYLGVKKVIYAHALHISKVIHEEWPNNVDSNSYSCNYVKYYPHYDTRGWADRYAITQGIMACCMEVFNGFPVPGNQRYTSDQKQCVSMINASIIASFCDYYSKH